MRIKLTGNAVIIMQFRIIKFLVQSLGASILSLIIQKSSCPFSHRNRVSLLTFDISANCSIRVDFTCFMKKLWPCIFNWWHAGIVYLLKGGLDFPTYWILHKDDFCRFAGGICYRVYIKFFWYLHTFSLIFLKTSTYIPGPFPKNYTFPPDFGISNLTNFIKLKHTRVHWEKIHKKYNTKNFNALSKTYQKRMFLHENRKSVAAYTTIIAMVYLVPHTDLFDYNSSGVSSTPHRTLCDSSKQLSEVNVTMNSMKI